MIPYLISYILSFLLESTPQLNTFNNISVGILFLSHGSSIFIYFAFNKLFRSVLLKYFQLKF